MGKQQWYVAFAVGLVLLFIIEPFAMGMLNSANQDRGSASGSGSGSSVSLTGNVVANATVVRYEPYLIVAGNKTLVEGVKQKLIGSGVATYAVPSGENLIINLKSSKSAVSAAAEFEKVNATAVATAVITTPNNMRVEGGGISTTVEGASFTMQIRPAYEEGAIVPVTFVANVQNGQIADIRNFAFLPDVISGVRVLASVQSLQQNEYVQVAWENRTAAKAIVVAENASYKEKSFISVQQNATKEQLDSALAAGKDYVTGVQSGIISVRNDFSDRRRAEADLGALGLQAVFPYSLASFGNASNGTNVSARVAALAEKLRAAGMDAEVYSHTGIVAKLPGSFEYGGKKYSGEGIVIGVDQAEGMNGTEAWLELDFQAAGSTITRITAARQVAAPEAVQTTQEQAGNATQAVPPLPQNQVDGQAGNASAAVPPVNQSGNATGKNVSLPALPVPQNLSGNAS